VKLGISKTDVPTFMGNGFRLTSPHALLTVAHNTIFPLYALVNVIELPDEVVVTRYEGLTVQFTVAPAGKLGMV
jgi:hypothetical protein